MILVISDWGGTAPPGTGQLLETAKDLARSRPLTSELTNSEPYLPYLACAPQKEIPVCLNPPRAGTRQLDTALIAQNPLELLTLAKPKLFTLTCLTFPEKIPIKAVT